MSFEPFFFGRDNSPQAWKISGHFYSSLYYPFFEQLNKQQFRVSSFLSLLSIPEKTTKRFFLPQNFYFSISIIYISCVKYLISSSILKKNSRKRIFSNYNKILWFFFNAGLIWSEVKQLWDVGLEEYVHDMWNVIDFVTNSLYVATVALRVVAYYRVINIT